jgi:hypothetical protein
VGEQVVVDGLLRLSNGARVNLKPAVGGGPTGGGAAGGGTAGGPPAPETPKPKAS